MNGGELLLWGSTTISTLGALATALWSWRRERGQPIKDLAEAEHFRTDDEHIRATIRQMADESNRRRDMRIWQLESYVDRDRSYHREIAKIVEQLIDALRVELDNNGKVLPDIVIPPPPEIPEPPNV